MPSWCRRVPSEDRSPLTCAPHLTTSCNLSLNAILKFLEHKGAMTERLQQYISHLRSGNSAVAALSQKNPDDVVITVAVRTPLTKAGKGGLKDTTLEHMLLRLYQVFDSSYHR